MTRKEAGAVIDRLSRLYMLQMKKLSREDIAMMVDTWADVFKDMPFQTVMSAVNIYAGKGKAFMPGPPDITAEILKMEERKDFTLYNELVQAAQTAVSGENHIVEVDPGGYRWSEEYQREVYYHPEYKWTTAYTAGDFSALPVIIQEYAEDIDGLRALNKEIQSDPIRARRRFLEALPYIRNRLEARA